MPNFYKRFHCCFIGISSFPIFRISTGCDFGLEDKMKRIFEIHAWQFQCWIIYQTFQQGTWIKFKNIYEPIYTYRTYYIHICIPHLTTLKNLDRSNPLAFEYYARVFFSSFFFFFAFLLVLDVWVCVWEFNDILRCEKMPT